MPELAKLLEAGAVVCHPFLLDELACGNLKNRRAIPELLRTLCACPAATHEEVLSFIEAHHLMDRGLGYSDMPLLASAKFSGILLWTLDCPLKAAASSPHAAYTQ